MEKVLRHYVAQSGEVVYLDHTGDLKVAKDRTEFDFICYQETLFWIRTSPTNRVAIPLREKTRIAQVMSGLDNRRFVEVSTEYTALLMKGVTGDYE